MDEDEPTADEDVDSDTADEPTVIFLLTILPPIMLTTLTVVHGDGVKLTSGLAAGVKLTLGLTAVAR